MEPVTTSDFSPSVPGTTEGAFHLVKATREGLIGACTACGWHIDTVRLFVALPSRKALRKRVLLVNPANNKTVEAEVLDVGPWNVADDEYVFGTARPLSEAGITLSGHGSNGAGIDLGEAVWRALDMQDNSHVAWRFLAT